MKKMLLVFLVVALPFGGAVSIILGNFLIGMTLGLLFGIAMTVILGFINYLYAKSSPEGKFSFNVKHEKEIELPLSFSQSFELCKLSITNVKGAKITFEDDHKGIIEAKTGVNIRTWGDKLIIRVQEINEHASKIHIESQPILPATLVDYGKNAENIITIHNYIKQNSINLYT